MRFTLLPTTSTKCLEDVILCLVLRRTNLNLAGVVLVGREGAQLLGHSLDLGVLFEVVHTRLLLQPLKEASEPEVKVCEQEEVDRRRFAAKVIRPHDAAFDVGRELFPTAPP